MKKANVISSLIILLCVFLAASVSFAGGSSGASVAGIPVFLICALFAFVLNWLAFIPANLKQTEHFYDLTGSITYLSVVLLAVSLSGPISLRALIVSVMVVVWAFRLGMFLFTRIRRDGKDDRFDEIKTNPLRFFITWTLQGLWVVLTAACALAIITGGNQAPMGLLGWIGVGIWVFGFSVEVIADWQKTEFKKDPENRGKFISSGLWSWSRHPNYFGEMVLWFGIAVMAISSFTWMAVALPDFTGVRIPSY